MSDLVGIRGWCLHQSTQAKANWTSSLRQCGLVETPATGRENQTLRIIFEMQSYCLRIDIERREASKRKNKILLKDKG
jgi:hypothetical protein